nr:EAL domain-containing protein [Microvirga antarctica]
MFWTVLKTDGISIDRQVRITQNAINRSVDELATQQQTIAVWDQAVAELQKEQPDWAWIDDEMGTWLHRLFGHDQVYILNARDEAVYAMKHGGVEAAGEYLLARPDLQGLVDGARQGLRAQGPGRNGFNAPDQFGRSGRFLEVLGQPAIASAMTIVPSTGAGVQRSGFEPVIVSVRFLAGPFLTELSARNLIEQPRLSRFDTALARERSFALHNDQGHIIGYFIWEPELPGTTILGVLGPVAAVVLVAILILTALLVWSLRRSIKAVEVSERHARRLALHDVLTGLANRTLFNGRLDDALAAVGRDSRVALLTLDLDRFKHVNDTLGHGAGDTLIRDFATRLSALMRPSDTLARLGGDEFAIVLAGVDSVAEIDALCEAILSAVHQPFELGGSQAFVGVSIGIAIAPQDGTDRVELIRKTDIALYRAKDEGRDCYRYFAPAMDEAVKRRSQIDEDLRAALRTGSGLVMYYQPQVAADSRRIVGLEALVRWNHPTRGFLSPEHFIPVAEETGVIVRLGEWALREVCTMSLRWPQLFLAVNVSAAQFRSSGFAERVIAIVREAGADPRRIELEVTESVLLGDQLTRDSLRTLRAAGFTIALDDFGTGHSSLGYLRQFQVDKITIDRTFVQHLGEPDDGDSAAIIVAIVTLGQALGLVVTAEGVETEDQRRFLSRSGCTEMQGYLFAHPIPEAQLAALLDDVADPAVTEPVDI